MSHAASVEPQSTALPGPEAHHVALERVFQTYARSFSWAAIFLGRQTRRRAVELYALCRHMDDLVDENRDHAPEDIARSLELLLREVSQGKRLPWLTRDNPHATLHLDALRELSEGIKGDLGAVHYQNERELMRYCYRVAGAVGILMCRALGVRDPRATAHAIDLGIAFQLTNICRDVREDRCMGRQYLPERWYDDHDQHRDTPRVVTRALNLAQRYYKSAEAGMRFIPLLARLAIMVASRVYGQIGARLLRVHHADPEHGRTVVPTLSKVWQTLKGVFAFITLPLRPTAHRPHDATLHEHLEGLPGAASDHLSRSSGP